MESNEADTAVALARAAVGAGTDVPASALRVRRLDRDASYVLVQLGVAGQPGWLAAVDPRAGEVLSWAVNASGNPTVPVRPATLDAVAEWELVWRPSAQSRSPLYPLLRLDTGDRQVFVDLAGRVWDELSEGRG